ncbi:hypothetical protein QQ045_021371 [Rhodiola kirilowii]
MSNDINVDELDEGLETPRSIPTLYYDYQIDNTMDIEEEEVEFVDEDDDELQCESDHVGSEDEDGNGGDEDDDELIKMRVHIEGREK